MERRTVFLSAVLLCIAACLAVPAAAAGEWTMLEPVNGGGNGYEYYADTGSYVITASGNYRLSADMQDVSSTRAAIAVTASDVTIDGNKKTITGTFQGPGIMAEKPGTNKQVNVENVIVDGFVETGISVNGWVKDVTVQNIRGSMGIFADIPKSFNGTIVVRNVTGREGEDFITYGMYAFTGLHVAGGSIQIDNIRSCDGTDREGSSSAIGLMSGSFTLEDGSIEVRNIRGGDVYSTITPTHLTGTVSCDSRAAGVKTGSFLVSGGRLLVENIISGSAGGQFASTTAAGVTGGIVISGGEVRVGNISGSDAGIDGSSLVYGIGGASDSGVHVSDGGLLRVQGVSGPNVAASSKTYGIMTWGGDVSAVKNGKIRVDTVTGRDISAGVYYGRKIIAEPSAAISVINAAGQDYLKADSTPATVRPTMSTEPDVPVPTKSPLPFAGILVGFSVAVLVFRK